MALTTDHLYELIPTLTEALRFAGAALSCGLTVTAAVKRIRRRRRRRADRPVAGTAVIRDDNGSGPLPDFGADQTISRPSSTGMS